MLIELKKGGFNITRKERDQAIGYIEDLLASNLNNDVIRVVGFVVGDSYDSNLSHRNTVDNERGILYTTTYGQLVDTAEKRMLGLRKILTKRYEDVPGMELYAQIQKSIK